MSGWELGDPPEGSPLHTEGEHLAFVTIELPKPKRLMFRGREIKVHTDIDYSYGLHLPIVLALLNLEDPRVDAVFAAFDFKLVDADGVQVWPPLDRG